MKKESINYSQKKLIFGLVICFVFIAAGVILLIDTLGEMSYASGHQYNVIVITGACIFWIIKIILLLIGIPFFTLCVLISILRLIDHKPYLIVDINGIIESSLKNKDSRIQWSDVKDITLRKKQLILLLESHAMIWQNKPRWVKSFFKTHGNAIEYPISFFYPNISAVEGYQILLTYYNESKNVEN